MHTWADIEGHTRARGVLERSMESGRMHHAYLFAGMEGVGKFLTAHTFAAVLNCHARNQERFEELCGRCPSCHKMALGQHPDVVEVRPDGQFIKIQQVREIQKSAHTSPYEARFRVVLIDDAHAMTEEAANALLKTLEEPSSRMRMILVTDQPHRLLDTIISRCQLIRFGALDQATVVSRLRSLLDADPEVEATAPEALLRVAAGYGEGSLGRALEALKTGMLEQRGELIGQILAVKDAHPRQVIDLAESFGRNKDTITLQLDVLKLFFRDVMLWKTGHRERLINVDLSELIAQVGERFVTDDVLELIEAICLLQERLAYNINPQLLLEDLIRRIARAQRSGPRLDIHDVLL